MSEFQFTNLLLYYLNKPVLLLVAPGYTELDYCWHAGKVMPLPIIVLVLDLVSTGFEECGHME